MGGRRHHIGNGRRLHRTWQATAENLTLTLKEMERHGRVGAEE